MSDYFNTDAISYSLLRNLSVGPAYLKYVQEQESEEKEHFIIGGAVDALLTEPEKFWDIYALEFQETCDNIPTGQMKDFADKLSEYYSKEYEDSVAEQMAYDYVGFKRKSLDSVISEYCEKYKDYDKWLFDKQEYEKSVNNKQILTNSQYELATKIVESLKTNRFTSKYFQNNNDFSSIKDWSLERINQLEIYWEAKGQKCKSKLDMIFVNHQEKTIQIFDLKTTGKSTFSFNSSALSFRYDIQASFYTSALYWLINKSNDDYWSKFKDYTILPFTFIVESTKTQGFPLLYKCSDKFLSNGMDGFYLNNKYYKGFSQLIDEYIWCKENNSWTYEKEIIENEGVINLEYC